MRAERFSRLFWRFWPYLRQQWPFFLIALFTAPASALLVIAQPWLIKVGIDRYVLTGDIAGIQSLALLFLATTIGGFVLDVLYSTSLSWGALRAITQLRRDLYAHTLTLSSSFFDRVPKGRLLTRITSDIEALGETLSAGAITIVLDAMLVVGILVALANLNVKLTLILLCVAPPCVLILEWLRRRLRSLYLEVRESLSEVNAFLSERIDGIALLQLYSAEDRAQRLLDRRIERFERATIQTNVYDALLFAIVDGVASICVALVLWYGADLVSAQVITLGTLVAYIEYLGKFFRPIREFSAKIAILQRAAAAGQTIFTLLDEDDIIQVKTPAQEAQMGPIHLEDLHFAYRHGPPVLKGITLDLQPGQMVALVGRTGSGKSTIGKLLSRTYEGYTGQITLNHVPLNQLSLSSVRALVGSVRQDLHLFPGTVRFNLLLGHSLSDAKIHEALKATSSVDLVERLGGLDGAITHRGRNLSLGEAQLLGLTRTLLRDYPIIVLDEATASVDSLTEAKLQQATQHLLAGRTTLVIAHRLSTIVHADQILLLDAGEVIERGNHHSLMEKNKKYARLFHEQFNHV